MQRIGEIPAGPQEMTPAWFTRVLGETYPGAEISDFTVHHVVHGTSSKICVAAERNEAAIAAGIPERLCVKVNWEPHAADTLRRAVWAAEGRFYRHLRPHLPAPAPRGYYGAYDETTGQGLVIMEDLTAQDAVFGSNGDPLTPDHAAAVLEDLADLHAAWWGSPRLEAFDWLLPSMGGPTFVDRYGGPQGLATLIEAPERATTMSEPIRRPDLWVKAVNRLVELELGSQAPRCLIHGDTHLGNSYYLPGQTLRWLDWQLVRKGRVPRELSYFLGCALDTPTRRASERDLIRHYLGALRTRGVETAPSFDDVWRDYQLWPIWGWLCWAVTGDGWQPVPVIHETMRRFATAIEDFDGFRGL